MMHRVHAVDLQLDIGMEGEESAHIVLTVHLPPSLPSVPVVCFAKPGGGYGRGYYTCDLPDHKQSGMCNAVGSLCP